MNNLIKKLEPIIVLILILVAPFYLKELWENLSWINDGGGRGIIMCLLLFSGGFGFAIYKKVL